jgi:hypothetical protein
MTVETERPATLLPTRDRNPSPSQPTSTTEQGGWYDPDSVAWEADAAPVFEAYRADTASPWRRAEDDGPSR